MSITYSGIEWDYDNLNGIGYDSETLLEPYGTWFYLITGAFNYEKESLGLGDDSDSISIHLQKDSLIKFSDYYSKNFQKTETESPFETTDRYIQKAKITSKDSIITLSEGYIKKVKKIAKESKFYMLDECRYIYEDEYGDTYTVEQMELSGSATIFDFELSTTPLNEKDFNSWCDNNCPVNYEELRPFIPGEYDYLDAYAGFRLTVPPTSGRFAVAYNTVYVDVEDTVERGDLEIEEARKVQVNFSKRFYTIPHVITSLTYSQERSFIELTNVTRDGFEIGIKSINTGNYVTGGVTWLADGY